MYIIYILITIFLSYFMEWRENRYVVSQKRGSSLSDFDWRWMNLLYLSEKQYRNYHQRIPHKEDSGPRYVTFGQLCYESSQDGAWIYFQHENFLSTFEMHEVSLCSIGHLLTNYHDTNSAPNSSINIRQRTKILW